MVRSFACFDSVWSVCSLCAALFCTDNTAVIVIIVICLLMLLVVLVVGAYYLVHGNTLNERPVETKVSAPGVA